MTNAKQLRHFDIDVFDLGMGWSPTGTTWKIWRYTFYEESHITREEYPIVLAEASLYPKANLERTTQTMFETANLPTVYVAI